MDLRRWAVKMAEDMNDGEHTIEEVAELLVDAARHAGCRSSNLEWMIEHLVYWASEDCHSRHPGAQG